MGGMQSSESGVAGGTSQSHRNRLSACLRLQPPLLGNVVSDWDQSVGGPRQTQPSCSESRRRPGTPPGSLASQWSKAEICLVLLGGWLTSGLGGHAWTTSPRMQRGVGTPGCSWRVGDRCKGTAAHCPLGWKVRLAWRSCKELKQPLRACMHACMHSARRWVWARAFLCYFCSTSAELPRTTRILQNS